MDTRYSPIRRSPSKIASYPYAAPRLACVKPAASVHPEPGSNSSLYIFIINLSLSLTIVSNKETDARLNLLACTFSLSVLSMNYPVSNGTAKVRTFSELPNISATFF